METTDNEFKQKGMSWIGPKHDQKGKWELIWDQKSKWELIQDWKCEFKWEWFLEIEVTCYLTHIFQQVLYK